MLDLSKIYPLSKEACRKRYSKHLEDALVKYEINTPNRQRAFFANLGVESAQLNYVEENLNYTASALTKVFGRYFTAQLANQYAKNPEKIANRVYANRMENRDENSGDGWKYRGRGLIQITGRKNYRLAGQALGVDLEKIPDLVATPQTAVYTAAWFWQSNGLNEMADKLSGVDEMEVFTKICKRINGGTHGLEERKKLYSLAKKNI